MKDSAVLGRLCDLKKQHLEQIRKINIACAILSKEKIKWTSEIRKIFKNEKAYRPQEIQNLLYNKGLYEAISIKKYNNVIMPILSRMVKRGELIRVNKKYMKSYNNKSSGFF